MPSVYGNIIKIKRNAIPQKVDKQVIDHIADWILSIEVQGERLAISN